MKPTRRSILGASLRYPCGMFQSVAMASICVALSASANEIPGTRFTVGFWEGAAFTDEATGIFFNCESSVGYRSGDTIYYSTNADGTQYIGIQSSELDTGATALTTMATVTVDSRQPRQLVALRAFPDFYLIDINSDNAVLNQFKAGRNLRIALNGKVLDYDLQDSARAVEMTQGCAETQRSAMRTEPAPEAAVAAPAPVPVPAPAPAAKKTQPDVVPGALAGADSADFFVGEIVEVTLDGTTWVQSTVTAVTPKGVETEIAATMNNGLARRIVVPAGNLRKRDTQPAELAPATAPATTPEPTSAPAFAVGDQVDILYGITWYPGVIKEILADGRWRISYDGYGSSWDENVGPDRLKMRGAPPPVASARSAGNTASTSSVVAEEDTPKTFSWPAHPQGFRAGFEGAYYSHTTSFFNNILQIYPRVYFLSANGRFAVSPSDGFSIDDMKQRNIALEDEGIYWLEGESVIFRYADERRNRDGRSFSGTHDGKRLTHILGNAATPVRPFVRGFRVSGACGGGASIGGGTSSATSLNLSLDGTYRWGSSVSFAVTGGNVERADGSIVQYETSGGSSGSDTGRYEFDGYALTFLSDSGKRTVSTVAAYGEDGPSGLPEYMYLSGSMMGCG